MNEELILKIKELFKDKKELMESLLSDDISIRKEAIRQIGTYSNSGFTSEEIIESYQNNDMKSIYEKAMRKNEIRILYYQLINEEPPKQLTKFLKK